MLLAVAIRGAADVLAAPLRLPGWAGVALVVLAAIGALGFAAWLGAPTLAAQADQLLQQVPQAWAGVRDTLDDTAWGRVLIEELSPGDLVARVGPGAAGMATAALAGTACWHTDAVFLLFRGTFLAATPGAYLDGSCALVAPELRDRCGPVLAALGRALRAWVGAQIVAMAIVGGLTFAGLTLLDMSLAGILAVVAALLGFIPILGPILAVVPALLLAFGAGWSMVLWVAGLYLAIQVIDGDLVTPLVQSRAIRLPPGLILAAQIAMLALFGLFGLVLAAPTAAVLLVLGQRLYVQGYLERGGAPGAASGPEDG